MEDEIKGNGKNVEDEIKGDEKYEDWSDDDLDTDNIIDFPTNSEQDTANREMLILKDDDSNPIDRRVQVFFNLKEFHTTCYFNLCHLTIKLQSKVAIGSAVCVPMAKNPFFLTCAHNLVEFSPRRKATAPLELLKVYKARNGWKSYVAGWKLNRRGILVHPKYNGYHHHGWDIGIFRVGKLKKKGKFNHKTHGSMKTIDDDVMLHWANADVLKKGMAVEIAGYPGKKGGYPYKHEGKIEDITRTDTGSFQIWYDADATYGNSGSSIMVIDKNFVKSVTKRPGIKKIIIGFHSGGDHISGLNYGTLITRKVYDWIKKSANR